MDPTLEIVKEIIEFGNRPAHSNAKTIFSIFKDVSYKPVCRSGLTRSSEKIFSQINTQKYDIHGDSPGEYISYN